MRIGGAGRPTGLGRRTGLRWSLALALLGVVFVADGCGGSDSPAASAAGPAPAWELERIRGGRLSLEDLQGRAVLLDFWATWCVPCIAAIPELNALHAEHEGRLAVVGISVDTLEDEALLEWVEDTELHDPIWYELLRGDMELAQTYGAVAFPHTVLISDQGELLETFEPGMQSQAEIENALRKHGQL